MVAPLIHTFVRPSPECAVPVSPSCWRLQFARSGHLTCSRPDPTMPCTVPQGPHRPCAAQGGPGEALVMNGPGLAGETSRARRRQAPAGGTEPRRRHRGQCPARTPSSPATDTSCALVCSSLSSFDRFPCVKKTKQRLADATSPRPVLIYLRSEYRRYTATGSLPRFT